MPGLLRLPSRSVVQRQCRAALAPVHHLPAPPARRDAIRYVKVAEYQARGVVHFHAVIRLDAPGEGYQPPPARITADLLCDAIGQAAAAVFVHATGGQTVCFGAQADTRPVRHDPSLPGTGQALSGQAVANYIAKYATKSLGVPGMPDHAIRSAADIWNLRCARHHKQMITTAWELGGGKLSPGHSPLCRWAHMLGYGGHFLTKSRRYSVTFGQLRRARTEHRKQQRHPNGEHDPWGRPLDDTIVLVLRTWTYAGAGYIATPDAELALASAARARAHRQAGTAA